ncbi:MULTISPECIES: VanZ family protein [unclassified Flavobacterium]|uniref:VanZ family protein n=1 Tax=unclassified Flavobacterium TaxID=196869 RepID=UPI003F93D80D
MPKKILFLAALAWTVIILFLCLVQSDELPVINVVNLDKYIHAFLHFVFTSLWILFFKTQVKNANKYKPLFVSFMLSVVLGIIIELLQQQFTTTRSADTFDVLANISGATLAAFLVLFYDRYKHSNSK